MCKVSLEEKQTLREQKHGAQAIVVDYRMCGAMLEAYHKVKNLS